MWPVILWAVGPCSISPMRSLAPLSAAPASQPASNVLPSEWLGSQPCPLVRLSSRGVMGRMGAGQPLKEQALPGTVQTTHLGSEVLPNTELKCRGTRSLQMPMALLWLGLLIDMWLQANVVLSQHSSTLSYCESPGQHLVWIFARYDLKIKAEI